MAQTPNVGLYYMETNQAQKEVIFNENMIKLDWFANPETISILTAPPASPTDGSAYLIGVSATGAWAGKDNYIARYINGAWAYYAPLKGVEIYNYGDKLRYKYSGTTWEATPDTSAVAAAAEAKQYKVAAETAKTSAETAATKAASSADAADTSESNAAKSATNAEISATAASDSANAAAKSETAAAKTASDLEGYYPTIKVESTASGATITCTDKVNGTTTADINNGQTGPTGATGLTGPVGPQGTSAYCSASTSDTAITITCKDANGTTTATVPIVSTDNFAGSMFDGTSSAGTKLGLAKNWTWEKSSDTYAGQDDYRKYGPFNQQRFLTKTDSTGVAQVVDWEGTSSFDNHLHDDDFGADPFVKFDLSYVQRYIDSDGKDYRMVSDRYLPGYHIPKIFLRGSGNTKYPWIGMSCRAFCKTTSGAITTRSGHPLMYNKTENQFETLARAKGLYVAGQNEINYLQHLGSIKYCNYNWQTAVGQGVTNTYYSRDKSCTVAQTSANSIIVSNANAAYVNVGDYIGFNGSGSTQPDLPVTSIETYDDSNKKIVLNGLSLTSVAGDTGFYRMCNWGGETDKILGLDGEISTGTSGKRSVKTLGIEDFFGNHWKLLAGACRIGTNIWINPNPDTSNTWPTSADNATTLEWIKLGGTLSTTEGYIKNFINDTAWPLTNYCSSVGGNSANPVGDYSYIGTNMTSPMIVLYGGVLSSGGFAGPFCSSLGGGVGAASWNFGALGVFLPTL